MNKIIYQFSASWCEPCKAAKKLITENFPEWPEGVQYVYVDVDESTPMAKEFGVRSIPTFVVLDVDTVESSRYIYGVGPQLVTFIKTHIS